MDEIQRSLRARLEAVPGAAARAAFFRNLPKDPDALSFWLLIAVRLSRQEPWWYDSLAALVRVAGDVGTSRRVGSVVRGCGGWSRPAKHLRAAPLGGFLRFSAAGHAPSGEPTRLASVSEPGVLGGGAGDCFVKRWTGQ